MVKEKDDIELSEKQELETIEDNRIAGQLTLNFLHRIFKDYPFPATAPKKEVEAYEKNKRTGRMVTVDSKTYIRKTRDITVAIEAIGDSSMPLAKDTPAFLLIISEAIRQRSRFVKLRRTVDYFNMYNIKHRGGSKYETVMESFDRLENFIYKILPTEQVQPDSFEEEYGWIKPIRSIRKIKRSMFTNDEYGKMCEKAYDAGYRDIVELDEGFFNNLMKMPPQPFNTDAVAYYIKKGYALPMTTHLFLASRVYLSYVKAVKDGLLTEGGTLREPFIERIPLVGEFGLINQLAVPQDISPTDFVKRLRKEIIPPIKEVWPRMPFELEIERGRYGKKFLKIELTDPQSQLDIPPSLLTETGRALRGESDMFELDQAELKSPKAAEYDEVFRFTECWDRTCDGTLFKKKQGKMSDSGHRMNDYVICMYHTGKEKNKQSVSYFMNVVNKRRQAGNAVIDTSGRPKIPMNPCPKCGSDLDLRKQVKGDVVISRMCTNRNCDYKVIDVKTEECIKCGGQIMIKEATELTPKMKLCASCGYNEVIRK